MAEAPNDGEAQELQRIVRFVTRPGPRFGLALALLRDRAGRTIATPAIANLNHSRDKLQTMLDARVVLWLMEASYASFRSHAWDLHEVMLTTAEFGRASSRTEVARGLDKDRVQHASGSAAITSGFALNATMHNEHADEPISDRQLVDELARVTWDSDEARLVVTEAGLPPQFMPSFNTPRVFWSRVVEQAANGAIAGGVDAIAHAAARQYPHNPVFTRYLAQRGLDD